MLVKCWDFAHIIVGNLNYNDDVMLFTIYWLRTTFILDHLCDVSGADPNRRDEPVSRRSELEGHCSGRRGAEHIGGCYGTAVGRDMVRQTAGTHRSQLA